MNKNKWKKKTNIKNEANNTTNKKKRKEKAEEPEIKLPTATGSSKKQESVRKISTSALLTMPKPLSGKFLKRWEYQTS